MADDSIADYEPARQFQCCECQRHIIQICGPSDAPALCAACMMLPGWYMDPVLCARVDPDWQPPNKH